MLANKRLLRLSTNDYRSGEVIDIDEWGGLSPALRRALVNQKLVRHEDNLAPKIRCNRARLQILGRTYAFGKIISQTIWQRITLRNRNCMISNRTVKEDYKNGYTITTSG